VIRIEESPLETGRGFRVLKSERRREAALNENTKRRDEISAGRG